MAGRPGVYLSSPWEPLIHEKAQQKKQAGGQIVKNMLRASQLIPCLKI